MSEKDPVYLTVEPDTLKRCIEKLVEAEIGRIPFCKPGMHDHISAYAQMAVEVIEMKDGLMSGVIDELKREIPNHLIRKVECTHCHGTGQNTANKDCCICSGHGWIPDHWDRERAIGPPAEEFTDPVKTNVELSEEPLPFTLPHGKVHVQPMAGTEIKDEFPSNIPTGTCTHLPGLERPSFEDPDGVYSKPPFRHSIGKLLQEIVNASVLHVDGDDQYNVCLRKVWIDELAKMHEDEDPVKKLMWRGYCPKIRCKAFGEGVNIPKGQPLICSKCKTELHKVHEADRSETHSVPEDGS